MLDGLPTGVGIILHVWVGTSHRRDFVTSRTAIHLSSIELRVTRRVQHLFERRL